MIGPEPAHLSALRLFAKWPIFQGVQHEWEVQGYCLELHKQPGLCTERVMEMHFADEMSAIQGRWLPTVTAGTCPSPSQGKELEEELAAERLSSDLDHL